MTTISTTSPLWPFHLAVAKQQDHLRQELVGKRLNELRTPTLVIDRTIIKRNCERLGNIKTKHNVNVRVHIKSHKTVEGTAIQLEEAKTDSIVVSTMAEAHLMVSSQLVTNGKLKQILLGFPITPDKFTEVFELAERVQAFQIFIDRLETLEALEDYHKTRPLQKKIGVFIKIDCGYGRAGVPLDSASEKESVLALAKRLASSNSCTTLHGLYAHAGHSYKARSPQEALSYLEAECNSAREFQAFFLKEANIDIPYLSIGATPTVQAIVHHTDNERVSKALEGITEVHAGAYSLLDRQQLATGLCTEKDIAISVACRVASRYPDRGTTLIDGGALAFSKDNAPQGGFGLTTTGVVLQSVSQEHGILASSSSDMHVGDIVRVQPNHCCLTSACHNYYLVVEDGGDQVVDVWFPVRGW